MTKILALDFDGVIIDSKQEIFMVGFNAYIKYFSRSSLFGGQELTFDSLKRVCKSHSSICHEYWDLVRFTSRGADYGAIFKLIDDHGSASSQDMFSKYKHTISEAILEDLAAGFYLERHRLQHQSINDWFSLMKPFNDIIKEIAKALKYKKDNVDLVFWMSFDRADMNKFAALKEVKIFIT